MNSHTTPFSKSFNFTSFERLNPSIIEGLNLSKDVKLNDLEKGVVCEFKLNELKAKLSKKTVDYLAEQGINLTEIIQYELDEIKITDENA